MKFSVVLPLLTCIACGLGLSILNGGPRGNCLRCAVELMCKLGVA